MALNETEPNNKGVIMRKYIVSTIVIAVVAFFAIVLAVSVMSSNSEPETITVTSSEVTNTESSERRVEPERQYIDDEYLNELRANTQTNKF